MVYSPNNIQVFLNGILLGDSDYTATNGASIVLTAGVSQDDEIRVAAFNSLFTVDIAGQIDSAYINARVDALPQDFAYASLTGTPNILDSADVIALSPPQDFAYASLTGTPTLFDGAYSSLTGTPTILDSAAVSAIAGAGGGGGGIDSAQLATEITQQLALLDIADIINDDGNPGDALVSTGNGGAEWSDIKATIRQKAIAMALLFRA